MRDKTGELLGTAIGKSINEVANFLTIIFLALQASGVINWHWLWLISPILFKIALVCILIMALGLGQFGAYVSKKINDDSEGET